MAELIKISKLLLSYTMQNEDGKPKFWVFYDKQKTNVCLRKKDYLVNFF